MRDASRRHSYRAVLSKGDGIRVEIENDSDFVLVVVRNVELDRLSRPRVVPTVVLVDIADLAALVSCVYG